MLKRLQYKWKEGLLNSIVTLCSLSSLVLLSYCFYARLYYPYELHWMDGGSIEHVFRFISGKSLYPEPALEFVPYTYPPLYFYLSSLIPTSLDLAYLPPRGLSVLSSLGTLLLIYKIISLQTRSRVGAIAGAGVYSATFEYTGLWFDASRSDSLFLCLILFAVWRLLVSQSLSSCLLAGVVFTLAFFTKQVSAIIIFPLLVWLLLKSTRQGMYVCGAGLVSFLLGLGMLIYTQGSLAWFYISDSPQFRWREHIALSSFLNYWLVEIFIAFLPMMIVLFLVPAKRNESAVRFPVLMLIVGLLLGGCMGRSEKINYLNTLMPGILGASIFSGVLIGQFDLEKLFKFSLLKLGLVLLLIVAQFGMFFYSPLGVVPSRASYDQGAQFIEAIQKIKGTVWVPDHAFIARLAGLPTFAHTIGMADVAMSGNGKIASALQSSIETALSEHKFSAIILDSGIFEIYFGELLTKYYQQVPAVQGIEIPPVPVLGWQIQPSVWVPR